MRIVLASPGEWAIRVRAIDRDANHSDFCGIIPFFKADCRITILDVKIPQNNYFTSKNGTR